MSDTHDECFGDSSFNPQPSEGIPMLLEARQDGVWSSIRIAREFPSVHAALDSLPMFARQQKANLDDVRAKPLRTKERVIAAERAVHVYNTRIGGQE